MRILIIENDPAVASMLDMGLREAGHCCDITDEGEDGVEIAKIYSHDLVIAALSTADLPGRQLIRALRARGVRTPTLALTDKDDIEARIGALLAGADDVVAKTIAVDEIVARAKTLVRRACGFADAVIKVGPIQINLDTREVLVNDVSLHFPPREFALIEALALRKDAAVTKDQLMSHLYLEDNVPAMKVIDVYVCKVRRKLIDASGQDHIHTVWGQGYALREQPVPPELSTLRVA